jgi:predicted DNA-binding protein (UPF0251 family)
MRTVTINDAARLKGVSRQAIHAAIKAGRLKTITVDVPQTRVIASSLKKFEPNPNMKRAGRKASGNGNNPK